MGVQRYILDYILVTGWEMATSYEGFDEIATAVMAVTGLCSRGYGYA